MTPDLLILGQITIDHVVPATPAAWYEALGGNALYAAAGARLWLDPARIGIVARRGPNLPAGIDALLSRAGLTTAGLRMLGGDNMVEWMIYETDGSRRNLPRAAALRDLRVDAAARGTLYLDLKAAVSATAADIPDGWVASARAIHLAPQVRDRHPVSLADLAGTIALVSVDPSPAYAHGLDAAGLATLLRGTTIFLPSQAEVGHLRDGGDWPGVARRLVAAGFPEVVVKLGADGAVVCADTPAERVPAAAAHPVDFTGAGDAFCGAYIANRMLGLPPLAAARRAVVAAAMVVECAGADAALALSPAVARERLESRIREPHD